MPLVAASPATAPGGPRPAPGYLPRVRRTPPLVLLALSTVLLSSTSCGGFSEKQQRPAVVATFPAADAVLTGWLGAIRVTYDEPITILNEFAVQLGAQLPAESIPCRAYPDLTDPRSILILPVGAGHLSPNRLHLCVVQEGAVVNAARHYPLEETGFYFTTGPAPSFYVTATDGNVYQLDPSTGASLATIAPPAGFLAVRPVSTDGRVWVWLDRIAVGDDELGTFQPGDATVSIVPLAGETGTRTLGGLVVSPEGRTVYATAVDEGASRVRVHRMDAATLAESGSVQLVTPTAGSPATFLPVIDPRRDHVLVPYSDGVGGGAFAAVDVNTFAEVDAGPNPGIDAYPMPAGAGDACFDEISDVVFMSLSGEATQGLTYARPDFSVRGVERKPYQGTAGPIFSVPTGAYVVTGLGGYAGTAGIVRSSLSDIREGFTLEVRDDVGGVLQGSNRVRTIVRDPASTRMFVICDGGTSSFLASYEWFLAAVVQQDLDPVTPGIQALPVGVPTPVNGATYLFGSTPP